MSKRNTTAKAAQSITMKQQVSKILLGQLIADAEGIASCKYDPVDRRIATLKRSISYNLINSGYHKNHSLASWSSEHFEMRFEYGKLGGTRISYMNNQGLQSAVFQASEWNCMMSYLKRKVDGIIDRLHSEKEEEIRKAEEEIFQRHVISVILDDIAHGDYSKIRNLLEVEQAIHGNPSDAHCKCSCTHSKVSGEVRKDTAKAASMTMDELEGKSNEGDFTET